MARQCSGKCENEKMRYVNALSICNINKSTHTHTVDRLTQERFTNIFPVLSIIKYTACGYIILPNSADSALKYNIRDKMNNIS